VDQVIAALIYFLLRLVAGAGIDQYNALAGSNLTRKTIANQNINAGATITLDVPCGGTDFVTVEVDMTAGAVGDLAVTVLPYEGDGLTLMPVTLPAVAGVGYGSTLSGGHDYLLQQYNVQGIDKVQIQIKNNNVGAQTITRASWRTQSW
jgi:hypothetical protein